jgi:hypothetical protein
MSALIKKAAPKVRTVQQYGSCVLTGRQLRVIEQCELTPPRPACVTQAKSAKKAFVIDCSRPVRCDTALSAAGVWPTGVAGGGSGRKQVGWRQWITVCVSPL